MTRLVVDASALVSGIIDAEDRPPALLLDAIFDRAFEAVMCPRVLAEVQRTLTRPYFQARYSPQEVDRTLRSLARAFLVAEAAARFPSPAHFGDEIASGLPTKSSSNGCHRMEKEETLARMMAANGDLADFAQYVMATYLPSLPPAS